MKISAEGTLFLPRVSRDDVEHLIPLQCLDVTEQALPLQKIIQDPLLLIKVTTEEVVPNGQYQRTVGSTECGGNSEVLSHFSDCLQTSPKLPTASQ